jgi:NAD(P)-dependent dehydrogenase (short-subunit alcohol dehydrogenase family)
MRLEGKSAIVTGAASGIGKEIALQFARGGSGLPSPISRRRQQRPRRRRINHD